MSLFLGFKGAEFGNGNYFVVRPLIHCVLGYFLSEVSSIRLIVMCWLFGNIHTWVGGSAVGKTTCHEMWSVNALF